MNQVEEASIACLNDVDDYIENANNSEVQSDNMQVACADDVGRFRVDNMKVNNEVVKYEDNQLVDNLNVDEDTIIFEL